MNLTCWLVGQEVGDARLRDRTEALVLAVRANDGTFITNPNPASRSRLAMC